jgi:hypothetical protein
MTGTTGSRAGLDDFVEAYESAQARDGHADLADYLPEPGSPLYRRVLVELVRVDLEYGWKRGRPCRVEEYLARFPRLGEDRESLHDIAFEEYRLRRQAGEDVAPAEYHQRFGLAIGFWPRPEAENRPRTVTEVQPRDRPVDPAPRYQDNTTDLGRDDALENAAAAYWAFRQRHGQGHEHR